MPEVTIVTAPVDPAILALNNILFKLNTLPVSKITGSPDFCSGFWAGAERVEEKIRNILLQEIELLWWQKQIEQNDKAA